MRSLSCAITLGTLCLSACAFPDLTDLDFSNLNLCPSVSRVVITPTNVGLRIGDQQLLATTTYDAEGSVNPLCGATWASSNPAAATVAADGTVTGIGPGASWVRATVAGKQDSVRVVMSTATVRSVTLEPSALELLVGQTRRLAATARDSAGNVLPVRRLTWSTSTGVVAGITSLGTVIARDAGTATVKVVVEGDLSATIPLTTSRNAPTVRFLEIAAATQHSCALVGGTSIPDGTAYCWGQAVRGPFGSGSASPTAAPVRVATNLTFAAITAGQQHTCAVTAGGEAYCWGMNQFGQLGDGTTTQRDVPTRVATSVPLHGLAAAASFTCGLAQTGAAYCWGSWANRSRSNVAALTGGQTFVQLSAGDQYVCGVTPQGRVYCWGSFLDQPAAAPVLTSGDVTFASIDAGDVTLCGIGANGTVYCWGINTGLFWDPTAGRRTSPIAVPGGSGFETIATGGSFVCGTTSTNVMCVGTLVGTSTPYTFQSVPRGADHPFVRIAGGTSHGCAIDRVGGGWCWGGNLDLQTGVTFDVPTQKPVQLVID